MNVRRRHSLSVRLLGVFLLAALAIGLLVRTGFNLAFSGGFGDVVGPHVAEYVQHLVDELGGPPTRERALALAQRVPVKIHFAGTGEAWSTDDAELPERRDGRHWNLPDGSEAYGWRSRAGFVLEVRGTGYTITFVTRRRAAAEWWPFAGLIMLAAVLAVLAAAYHAIRHLFRPVETIRAGVAQFGAGALGHRITVSRRDELGELARDVNHMADDIARMLEAKRQLLLAISHELRSPLTRARVNLALLPESVAHQALARDLREMDLMLNELLEGERLNTRHAALRRTAVDPAELVREIVAEHFADRPIALRLQGEGAYIALDATRVRLMVRNLIGNALRHTPALAPEPEIDSTTTPDCWRFVVRDHGPGVAPEHLTRLTEPFYRADAARRRETGGVGLGLYLCRMVAEAHGGVLEIVNAPGGGLAVAVTIPASTVGDGTPGAISQ